MNSSLESFKQARKLLLDFRDDYASAVQYFQWPQLTKFNWAYDWFDSYAKGNQRIALWITRRDGAGWADEKVSFEMMSTRSSQLAYFLKTLGLGRGDRVMIMLPNVVPLWETMLAAMKIGAVIVPTTTQATDIELRDRIARANVKFVITDQVGAGKFETLSSEASQTTRVLTDGTRPGWINYSDFEGFAKLLTNDHQTNASDPLWLYFTSGTTSKPKLVLHTHESYPVGHLSTMYWIGLHERSIHQNISSPGWAKHAWSSFYAPWNAGATIVAHDYSRFDSRDTVEVINRCGVTSVCAPPTVWRMLILSDLGPKPTALTDLVGAGEPLNPEVIETVKNSWGIEIRDGFGQTETTIVIGNTPGQLIKQGAMGRPLPGYKPALLDPKNIQCSDGEVSLSLSPRPLGLMIGYDDDAERTSKAIAGGYYRTGDEAKLDEDGYYHYVGRGDDVFKSSDFRISPFELESVLIEHDSVAEAAVIPSPDAVRLSVPKAVIALAPGYEATRELAKEIFEFANAKLPAFKRIRRIEFGSLPKTISGKIRRVELRSNENARDAAKTQGPHEYRLDEL